MTGASLPTADELAFEIRIDKEELESIGMAKVRSHLEEYGITFDTGYCLNTGERCWFLDWSLAGATAQTVMGLLRDHGVTFEALVDTDKKVKA